MNRKISILGPAVAALCLLLAGGCEKENKTIKIATQCPLSGSQSAIGVDLKNAAAMAMEQLGEPLTKMGFKLELAPFDDQANPDTGVANAKAIVSDPAILAVVAHYNSGVCIPSSEEYHQAGLCAVSPGTTNPKVTDRAYPEVNRVCGRDDVQGGVGAEFAKSLGIKKVWVLSDKGAYGQGIADYFKKEAEARGIKVLGSTDTEEKDNFDSVLSPIINAKPDTIYFGGMFDHTAVFYKQAREKGFKGLFLTCDGLDSSDATKIAGKALTDGGGTYYSSTVGPPQTYPNTAKFITDFKAKYNAMPQPYCAQAYDAMGLILRGIEDAAKADNGKMPTRADVCKAVRAVKDFPGITGNITLNDKGDKTTNKYFVLKVASPDPAKWADNKIVQSLDIAPPK
jgi:branched-chain amino acid transport system substrate-binding protein